MSILIGSVALLMTLTFGAFFSDLAGATTAKARAQLAADAAALAAVHESGPYGGAVPRAAAERFARRNEATLRDCDCLQGATEMQVEVEVDGVVAWARAEIEPGLIGPLGPSEGLHPRLAAAVEKLVAASAAKVWVVSGWRDPVRQRALWANALRKYGDADIADDWVARPGHSMHERGLAVDLGGDIGLAVRLIDELELPMWRPMSWEPWHFELMGSRS
jgi:hypothetical protein